MLFIFQGAFTIGFQATVWVYPSEILPLKARQKGSSISTAANWICNFIIVYITPPAIRNIGWKTYIIFGVLNTVWVPIIVSPFQRRKKIQLVDIADNTSQYLFFPETKGELLEALQSLSMYTDLILMTGLALEDVDKLFAPEGLMDAVIDSKVPDVEAIEVSTGDRM